MWFATRLTLYSLSILCHLAWIFALIDTIYEIIQYRNLLSSELVTYYLPLLLAYALLLGFGIGTWIIARNIGK